MQYSDDATILLLKVRAGERTAATTSYTLSTNRKQGKGSAQAHGATRRAPVAATTTNTLALTVSDTTLTVGYKHSGLTPCESRDSRSARTTALTTFGRVSPLVLTVDQTAAECIR